MNEWGDKDPEMEGWHHRGHMPGPHRGRMHGMFSFSFLSVSVVVMYVWYVSLLSIIYR